MIEDQIQRSTDSHEQQAETVLDGLDSLHRRLIAYGMSQEVHQPVVLTQLYGSQLTTLRGVHEQVFFVDDHPCE